MKKFLVWLVYGNSSAVGFFARLWFKHVPPHQIEDVLFLTTAKWDEYQE